MPRFFVEKDNINNNHISVCGKDAVHIGRSLRMKIGDELILCCDKIDYTTKILSISDSEVLCEIISQSPTQSEAGINLILYQAMPKLDKLELITQKAVELGVVKIIPVITSRCISRPDRKSFSKKKERLSKIALEAAKQSGRGIIPEISDILDFKSAVSQLSCYDFSFVCYEKGGVPFSSIVNPSDFKNISVGLFIGSEGGFDESEIKACEASGIKAISLGKRILRCETAPISAVSIIMALSGNM